MYSGAREVTLNTNGIHTTGVGLSKKTLRPIFLQTLGLFLMEPGDSGSSGGAQMATYGIDLFKVPGVHPPKLPPFMRSLQGQYQRFLLGLRVASMYFGEGATAM